MTEKRAIPADEFIRQVEAQEEEDEERRRRDRVDPRPIRWERFTKGQKITEFKPMVSVYSGVNGMIVVNLAAYEAIGRPKGVVLFFERTRRWIGIEPGDPTKPDCYLVRKPPGNARGCQLSAKTFIQVYGINPGRFAARVLDGRLIVDTTRDLRPQKSGTAARETPGTR